jgi:acetylglutamate kinase
MTDTPIMLKQAVPYIRLYKGKVFVIKFGGRVVAKREALSALVEDVSLLQQVGVRTVLVHGGGDQATALSRKLGVEPEIVAGRRVTDAGALEIAKMVYGGALNIDILSTFRAQHTQAAGVSGVDAGLITAKKRPMKLVEPAPGQTPVAVDYGFVGDIEAVDPKILLALLDAGVVPVVACLGADRDGSVLNINADSVAESVARALGAEKLIVATDTEGILNDVRDPSSLASYLDVEEIEEMKRAGKLGGGMLPKVEACARALGGGVKRTHIINGLKPGALLREIFTNEGCGTMIVGKRERQAYQSAELSPEALPA